MLTIEITEETIDTGDMIDVLERIVTLVKQGYTSGVEPSWSLKGEEGTKNDEQRLGDPTEYTHKYSVSECPECDNDLTSKNDGGGVTIVYGEDGDTEKECVSVLAGDNNTLVDVDDVIEQGWHKQTLCRMCSHDLADEEDFG
jgi:hypothetical protein